MDKRATVHSGLSDEERCRYHRQMLLPEIGEEGQLRLRQASVAVIGAGALGSAAAFYLAAAGVGRLVVVDGDVVDLSNLQRQVIHSTPDVGRPKVESASEKLRALNPGVTVETMGEMLTPGNFAAVTRGVDFLIDATDNYESKFIINDLCVAASLPFSHGAIRRFGGQLTTWTPGAPCYRCLFREPPASEPHAGPFGALPGVVGSIQATEAIKHITGIGELLTGRLLTVDLLSMSFHRLDFARDGSCPCCGQ